MLWPVTDCYRMGRGRKREQFCTVRKEQMSEYGSGRSIRSFANTSRSGGSMIISVIALRIKLSQIVSALFLRA